MNIFKIFLYIQSLNLNGYGEHGLLHDIWRYMYRIFTNNHIKVRLAEKTGIAVTLARSKSRSLKAIEKRPGKKHGFQRRHSLEFNEAGKDTVRPIDEEYLNVGLKL